MIFDNLIIKAERQGHRTKVCDTYLIKDKFFWQSGQSRTRATMLTIPSSIYLDAAGRHLRRLVVDLESVPARRQRVVTDQILYGRVLDLCGVKVNAAVGITQSPMASRETLWS